MITEVERLPSEEFWVLSQVADGFQPDPNLSIAIVARKNGEIVGRVFLVAPTHVEGPWVSLPERRSTLGKRLMDRAEQEAKACGISKLFAYGASDELEDYLARLGYKREPYTVWSKEI